MLQIENLEILSKEEKSLNPKKDDAISLISVNFKNENIIDIDICSGSENYYDNCVLKDKEGHEITCFDCNYSIDNEMEFHYGNDTYIMEIKVQ